MNGSTVPVLFIVFNRPLQTQRVFEEIRKAKPKQLFIAADGPRASRESDKENCAKTRQIVSNIDWDCNVKTLFREKNLGCKNAVSEAITWFFNHVEKGIILEDDCVPSQSFFGFSQQMLDKYQHDERVMLIAGTNLLGSWNKEQQDYFFSNYGGIWGWASWQRAWQLYDVNMSAWGDAKAKMAIANTLADDVQFKARKKVFDSTYEGHVDTWDYQWSFCRMINSGLSIVPSVNLVSNIGFGAEATHTTGTSDLADQSRYELKLPVRDNPFVVADRDYDRSFFNKNSGGNILQRIRNKILKNA